MKTFIKVNKDGDIIACVMTNDHNFHVDQDVQFIEIKDENTFLMVSKKPHYFRFQLGQLIEKSAVEKQAEDDKRAIKPNSIWDKLADLENKIVLMQQEIDRLKKK